MVTIRHKQIPDKTEIIGISIWNSPGRYDKDLWDLISIEDAVNLFSKDKYGKWVLHNTVEKKDAIQVIGANPNQFKYEDIPNYYLKLTTDQSIKSALKISQKALVINKNNHNDDLFLESLHAVNPETNADQTTKNHVGIGLLKNWVKNISIKNIFEMVIAALIVALIIYWFHLNAVRNN